MDLRVRRAPARRCQHELRAGRAGAGVQRRLVGPTQPGFRPGVCAAARLGRGSSTPPPASAGFDEPGAARGRLDGAVHPQPPVGMGRGPASGSRRCDTAEGAFQAPSRTGSAGAAVTAWIDRHERLDTPRGRPPAQSLSSAAASAAARHDEPSFGSGVNTAWPHRPQGKSCGAREGRTVAGADENGGEAPNGDRACEEPCPPRATPPGPTTSSSPRGPPVRWSPTVVVLTGG